VEITSRRALYKVRKVPIFHRIYALSRALQPREKNVKFALKNRVFLPVDKWIKISEKSAGDEPD